MQLPNVNNHIKTFDISGGKVLREIARLIQTVKLYDDNNKMIIDAVNTFKQALKKSSNDSQYVSLQIFNGRFLDRKSVV